MTTMAEQVEQEQDEFEHGEDAPEEDAEDAEDAEEPETDTEEPELRAIGPEEIAKAEKAIEAQRKKLAGILGEEYVAHDCLFCSSLGFLPELPPLGTTLLIAENEDGPFLAVQPPEEPHNYPQAKDKGPCDWCDAEGFVDTGSKNPNAKIAPCGKCNGNGWVAVPADAPAPSPISPPAPELRADGSPNPVAAGPDAWGRPAGHLHWGVPPASIPG